MSTVDEVKQRTDIVAIIGESVHLTKAGRCSKGFVLSMEKKHPLSSSIQSSRHGIALGPATPAET